MNRDKFTHKTNESPSAARKLDLVLGRDGEIQRVLTILSRRTTRNNAVLLIAEPGVSTTAVVEGVAQRVVTGCVPRNLTDVRLITLDLGDLVVGVKSGGKYEKSLKDDLKKVEEAGHKAICVVNKIHLLFGAGRTEESIKAANLFNLMLSKGRLRCIGATTPDEYRKFLETDVFESQFEQVYVVEPSIEDTTSILRGLKRSLKGFMLLSDTTASTTDDVS